MASWVSIANRAIVLLGVDTFITSLTDGSKPARLINAIYEDVRDEVLREYPWNCAMSRAVLTATTDPTWGFDHAYVLPTIPYCLSVRELEERNDDDTISYKVEGRTLVTDADTATILYTKRITDPQEIDPKLREVISYKIAAEIAYGLTGSQAVADSMENRYRLRLRAAKGADAQEGTPDELVQDTWLNARL